MAKWIKRIGVVLIGALVLAQFVPVAQSNPPERGNPPAPAEVQAVLRRACYDCHSNETVWPWYAKVAPASLLIAHDVDEGRKELNFSLWDQYNDQRKTRKKKEIVKEVEKGDMPLWYYTPLHPDAKLSASDRELILNWARQQ